MLCILERHQLHWLQKVDPIIVESKKWKPLVAPLPISFLLTDFFVLLNDKILLAAETMHFCRKCITTKYGHQSLVAF